MSRRTRKAILMLAGLAGASCSGGPSLPKEIVFDLQPLEKAGASSSGGVSSVVFIPPGEKLETASLQVGVLMSTRHHSASELDAWVTDQYFKAGPD